MSRPIRVLGVDPGTRVAGFGVLDVEPGKAPKLVDCGPIRLPAGAMGPRLRSLHEKLTGVILKHQPDVLSVETVFQGRSFQSVVKVGEARGVVLLTAELNGLDIHEFSPAMVKKTATGNGRSSKAQVQQMVTRLLNLEVAPEPVDVSDALAIAFCYGQRVWRRQLAVSTSASSTRRKSRAVESRRWEALVKKQEARNAKRESAKVSGGTHASDKGAVSSEARDASSEGPRTGSGPSDTA